MAQLQCNERAGVEVSQGVFEETLHDAQAIGAAIEGEDGIALYFGAELRNFGGGDVGQIGGDDVKGAGDFFKEITAQKLHIAAQARAIEPGEIQRVFADVCQHHLAQRPGFGEAEADAAGAGGHVQHARGRGGAAFEDHLHQRFGFRAWDEGAVVAHKFMAAKFHAAQQVLQRLPFTATLQQIAQLHEFRLGHGFAKAQIQIQPAAVQHVGQQVLHVQASLLDLALLQVGGAGLDDFEDELHGK